MEEEGQRLIMDLLILIGLTLVFMVTSQWMSELVCYVVGGLLLGAILVTGWANFWEGE